MESALVATLPAGAYSAVVRGKGETVGVALVEIYDLDDHFLTPDFSAYRESALNSAYPHNGVIAALTHAQHGLVGYAHPFDEPVNPEKDPKLSNALPADVALGNADYYELVGFSDHRSTADVWYRLLNLGFRVPAGAGTDAMANYASLRGPVGMNRVFIAIGGETTPEKLHTGLKQGRTFASNGPLLGLEVDGKHPGDEVALPKPSTLSYRASLRSIVSVDHFELVFNGRVIADHHLEGARTQADVSSSLDLRVYFHSAGSIKKDVAQTGSLSSMSSGDVEQLRALWQSFGVGDRLCAAGSSRRKETDRAVEGSKPLILLGRKVGGVPHHRRNWGEGVRVHTSLVGGE